MLMNNDGEILIDTKEIKHNLEDFEKVKAEIKEINPENLTVFMESTGTYHLPVERYFKENGFNTLVINSLTTKNNYDTIRKTKTDKEDCYRLAKLFFVNEVKYHDFSDKSVRIRLKESLFENINYLIIPFFLGYEEIGKNYYNELQFYDFYMINYTISGNARFTVNNLTFDIEQGDLILLHAYQKRIFVPEGPWNIYCMHIKDDGSQLANLYGKFHNDNNYIIKNFPRDIIEKHFSKISESMQSFTPDLYELSVDTYSLFVDIIEFSDSRIHFTITN